MEFFDGWKTLNARFDMGDLTALTQLVGYKLFVIFDEHRFPDSLPISDRELMSRTNIQSHSTIVEARRRLKNAELIDFDVKQGKKTRYRLTLDKLPTSYRQVDDKLSTSCRQVDSSSNIRTRDPVTPTLNPYPMQNKRARDTQEEIDSLLEYWEKSGGAKLNHLLVAKLNALLENNELEVLKAAIDMANSGANNPEYGFSIDYIKGKLEELKNGKKGGAKRERADKRGGFDEDAFLGY